MWDNEQHQTSGAAISASNSTMTDSSGRHIAERLMPFTPLSAMSSLTRMQMSEMLNCRKVLRHLGYHRDWRGLAELANVRNFCNDHNDDPMHSVLVQWSAHNPEQATFFHLLDFLTKIDRWDVYDDLHNNLAKDALHYASNSSMAAPVVTGNTLPQTPSNMGRNGNNSDDDNDNAFVPEPCDSEHSDKSSDDGDNNPPTPNHNSGINERGNYAAKLEASIARIEALSEAQHITAVVPATTTITEITKEIAPLNSNSDLVESLNPLTRQDAARLRRGLPMERYDAFVLYDDADQQYATEMQKMLEENNDYNFRLVFKNRDLLGGTSFYEAVTELVENRCNYLLLILTRNLYKEYENFFFINNTAALQISQNSRRLIPLAYDSTKVRTLRGVYALKYGSEGFWDKLAASISIPNTAFISLNENAFISNKLTPDTSPSAPCYVSDEDILRQMAAVKLPEKKSKTKAKKVIEKVRGWTLQKS